ncbi:hypothetical protein [Thermus sp.]|uniref:hypothetical protein n=1 Tax=Thermus sp. TaxID=275 RepID=UPI00298F0106|nr:hypothetical protein [Thermus sp.]MDW8358099.1 hypothetical protein [Thermus sp.]
MDLQAFPAAFGEERRPLEGGRWTYHVWPKTPEGQYGEPATATVAVRREAEARLVLDVKRVLYQRLRFHGEARGVFVALQEHVHEQKPLPQALIKARYALAERAFGDRDLTATFRAVAGGPLPGGKPGTAGWLALYFTARLLADFPLLEALGWDGLTLTRATGCWTWEALSSTGRRWPSRASWTPTPPTAGPTALGTTPWSGG